VSTRENESGGISAVLNEHAEKVRYLAVGVFNTAVGYVVFVSLLAVAGPGLADLSGSDTFVIRWVGEHYYLFVQWLAWVLMVPVSTSTMKFVAFRSGGSWARQIGKAYFVYLPAQALSNFLLWFTVRVLGLSPAVGQLLTIAFATVFSYLGHKHFTFRSPLVTGEIVPEELLDAE
jgi:putative flippase GtrA